jgi:tetratricopeptide (TPR) repeat protein
MGSPKQQADFCGLLGRLNNRRQRYRISTETISVARRGLELAEQAGDPLVISRKRFDLGFNLLWSGDRPAAIAQFDQALAQAEKLGATFCQNQALAYLAIAHRMDGNPETVHRLAQRGLALAEAEHHPTYQGTALANLAWLAYRRDDLPLAERLAKNALECWQAETNYPTEWLADFPLAAIAMRQGDLSTAGERLAAMLRAPQQRLPDALEAHLQSASSSPAPETIYRALDTASQLGYL